MEASTKQQLKALVQERAGVVVPGAFNALSAKVIQDLGYRASYVTGAGVTNMSLGLPDQGFMGLAEIADHTARIRDAVDLPLLVDADTGFGNALNVRHTVRVLERAGADCIQFEDQVSPKRCGHFDGKSVIGTDEAVNKIKAAVDARTDENLLIMARTDAAAVHGFEAAVERARQFGEAGADILFVEALTDREQVLSLPGMVDQPLLANLVIGGKTPLVSAPELAEAGYGIVLYANAALQGAVFGMQNALTALRDNGRVTEEDNLVVGFAERQRLVDKPMWDALNDRYSS
ncbi:MAG TPA: oxaloacetate decarboxylase [Flexivirga sp.]|uniref:isocitrate lyase/PEP mutase family protein n=1 Tax=Flexivirga sp. TaxID=1962927 RepID=UPI002D131B25|nr:oxaloacetate decarboxylase [Flexivirga sp.]HWC22194.1 oxaloacetate decarboxylase [Flexivirga sp.]